MSDEREEEERRLAGQHFARTRQQAQNQGVIGFNSVGQPIFELNVTQVAMAKKKNIIARLLGWNEKDMSLKEDPRVAKTPKP